MKTVEELSKNVKGILSAIGDYGFCRGCNQPVTWVKHRNGKPTPYNEDGSNHFSTCPNADNFRKKP
ncbi:MAG: hypothetical protein AMXMBFR84_26220 [Candidatus Hydrogenedentota bacterium]